MPRQRSTALLPLLFVGSGLAQYFGSAVAVSLFALFGPTETAWLRGAGGALVMVLWRRLWRRSTMPATWRQWGATALFGVILLAMNTSFYIGIAHLPMGTAVAMEFMGPVVVAAVLGRGVRERVSVVIAALGVLLLAGMSLELGTSGDARIGLIAIAVAAATWAGYIVLGQRIASTRNGVDSLGWSLLIAVVLYFPFTGLHSGTAWSAVLFGTVAGDTGTVNVHWVWLTIVVTALCTTVIPYSLEQVVMRHVSASIFAILLAMLPAMATVIGVIFLHQLPTLLEIVGLVLVSAAVALSSSKPKPPAPPEVVAVPE